MRSTRSRAVSCAPATVVFTIFIRSGTIAIACDITSTLANNFCVSGMTSMSYQSASACQLIKSGSRFDQKNARSSAKFAFCTCSVARSSGSSNPPPSRMVSMSASPFTLATSLNRTYATNSVPPRRLHHVAIERSSSSSCSSVNTRAAMVQISSRARRRFSTKYCARGPQIVWARPVSTQK